MDLTFERSIEMYKKLLKLIGLVGLFVSKGSTLASFWFIYEPDLPKKGVEEVKGS